MAVYKPSQFHKCIRLMQTQEDIDQDIIEECCQECDVEERNTPDNTNLAVMNAVGATPTTLPNTDSQ